MPSGATLTYDAADQPVSMAMGPTPISVHLRRERPKDELVVGDRDSAYGYDAAGDLDLCLRGRHDGHIHVQR